MNGDLKVGLYCGIIDLVDSTIDEPPTARKEARRLRAWELVQQGWKQKDVAAALGVTGGAVSRWVSKAGQGGAPALRRRRHPGGRPKLNDRQPGQIPELLVQGPAVCGFSGGVWTRAGVARVIEQEFGVSCGPSQVGRILRGCGWSRQKPGLRSTQRDEPAIRDWREWHFAELKKRSSRRPDHPVGRCVRFLPAARFAAHPASSAGQALGAGGPDPSDPAPAELRPAERD